MYKIPKLSAATKEQLLLAMIHSATDFCIVTDEQRSISLINSAVLCRFGYHEGELIGQKDTILFPKHFRAAYTTQVYKHLADDGKWNGKLTFLSKRNEEIDVFVTVWAMYDVKKNLIGSILIGHEETGEKLIERHDWKSDGILQKLFDTMRDAVLLLDENGKILQHNEAFIRMFGLNDQETSLVPTIQSWLDVLEQKRLREAMSATKSDGFLSNFVLKVRKEDQSRVVVSCSLTVYNDETNHLSGFVVTLRDITNVHFSDELSKIQELVDRLFSEVHRKSSMFDVLNEIHSLVLKNASFQTIMNTSVAGISKILSHDLAGIYLYDPEEKKFIPNTFSKQTPFSENLSLFPLAVGEGIIGTIKASDEILLVNNAQNDPRSKYPQGLKPSLEHFIAAPLRIRETIYGILVVARNREPGFIDEEAQLLKSFADATTLAMVNLRLLNPISHEKTSLTTDNLMGTVI